MPEEVWQWYLYRRGVCGGAKPNAAHRALVRMQQLLGSRMLLATQNVDGLHYRAGSAAGTPFTPHPALKAHMSAINGDDRSIALCTDEASG